MCAIRLFYARWPSRTLWFRKVRLLNAASHPHKLIRLPGQFTSSDCTMLPPQHRAYTAQSERKPSCTVST